MDYFTFLFRAIRVVSFNNDLTGSLKSSANSFVSDFIWFGKLFISINNNKGLRTDLWRTPEGIFCILE